MALEEIQKKLKQSYNGDEIAQTWIAGQNQIFAV